MAPSSEITAAERLQVTQELTQSRDALLASLPPLDSPAWQARADAKSWSVAGILEHLVIVERRIHGRLESMLTQPPEPDWHDRTAHQDELVPGVATVTEPVNAPEPLHPQGGRTPSQLREDFLAARAALLEVAARPALPLKEHTFLHPVMGPLNGLQCLRTVAYHSDRHRKQMQRCLL